MSTHHLRFGQRTLKVVLPPPGSAAPITVDGAPIAVHLREIAPGILSLLLTAPDGTTRSFRALAESRPGETAIVLDGQRLPYTLADPRSLRSSASTGNDTGPRNLKAPMPGRIVRVLVAEGDLVEAGQGCIVIEAMKMQNELKAPRAGTIAKLSIVAGETVAANAVLLVIQ